LKVNDKVVTDKTEIANKLQATFYLTQHKLEPKLKKKENIHRKQKSVNKGDGHLEEELFAKEFSMEELKEAITNTSNISNQDQTKYSQNLLKTLVQQL
jgi:hypothetical protein